MVLDVIISDIDSEDDMSVVVGVIRFSVLEVRIGSMEESI